MQSSAWSDDQHCASVHNHIMSPDQFILAPSNRTISRITRPNTHVEMMIIAAFCRWSRLVLAEAEIAATAAATTAITSGRDTADQEQRLKL